MAVKEWAKRQNSNVRRVMFSRIGFGKPGNHAMTFENFALDPKWSWKLKQLV